MNVEQVPTTVMDIYDDLICPACKEFSVCPIYACREGHILCGLCVEIVKKCPTPNCKDRTFEVNAALELLVASKGIEVPCRNSQEGCTLIIKPSEMIEHLRNYCDLSPMKCLAPACDPDCVNKLFKPKELFDHWVNVHKIVFKLNVLPAPAEGFQGLNASKLLGVIKRRVVLTKEAHEDALTNAGSNGWLVSYFELDGQTFFVRMVATSEMVHMWIPVLGMESVAKAYRYSATLMSGVDINKNIVMLLEKYSSSLAIVRFQKQITYPEIPVHSLRFYELEKVEALGHTVAVDYSTLKLLQEEEPKDKDTKFEWRVKIVISKVNDS